MDIRTYDKDAAITEDERKRRERMMTEEVRGVIIGGEYKTYKFFKTVRIAGEQWQEQFAHGRSAFDNDTEAEEWLRTNYPNEYAQGVEMRCYD
jgi:hypothetical protein